MIDKRNKTFRRVFTFLFLRVLLFRLSAVVLLLLVVVAVSHAMPVQLPWWYALALQAQGVTGAVTGAALLVAPVPPLLMIASAAGSATGEAAMAAAPDGLVVDIARCLGAAHVCLAAMAWVALRYRAPPAPDLLLQIRLGAKGLYSAGSDKGDLVALAVVGALALPAFCFFTVAVCFVWPSVEARAGGAALVSRRVLLGVHVTQAALMVAHAAWLLAHGREALKVAPPAPLSRARVRE